MSSQPRTLYRRLTASVPLLITVIVHVVLVAVAGYFVTEQLIGKKKTFEASAASEPSIAQKQVEHRLQVARKAGGSASASPVSAARIFSTAENALQMPAMPDLPSVGASALSGMGFGKGMGAVGTGTGYGTGLGASLGTGGRGFMSMSFLGVTNQRASKVIFIVDISSGLMDIRKGGFRAFEILRHEISRLVSTLPPSNEFNVILFDSTSIRLFAGELTPATVGNKTAFFEWIKPINADLQSLGMRSIPASSPRWSNSAPEDLKLDPEYRPPFWAGAIHAALQQKPDTVFLITGSVSPGSREASQEKLDRDYEGRRKRVAELLREGYDLAAIAQARGKALGKLRAEFDEVNRQLVARKKDPFIIQSINRVLDADFQAALKKAGFSLKLDTTGWTDKQGKPMWDTPSSADVKRAKAGKVPAEFSDAIDHIARLQFGLVRERASINTFLFVGPEEGDEKGQKNLSALSSRNGGKFSLLTTKRLEEIIRASEEKK
ncbi:MAG: hypothetical protein K0R17_746 [Rariglobus sp.]|jgi:hypothetical protein|nr:hypothetical protein [Rariglobus sp.]